MTVDTRCTLCDLPTPDPPVTEEAVAGTFCCRGCLEVARTLDAPAETDPAAARAALGTSERDGMDVDPDVAETAYLRIDGMHCTSCEAFLEHRAIDVAGVVEADANYPADAMRVRYDPDRTRPDTIAARISGLGYTVAPLNSDRDPAASTDDALGRLLVGGFFAMMVMAWYVLFLYPTYFGLPPETLLFDIHGSAGRFLLANVWAMSTVVLGYTGAPLLRGAYVAVRTRQPNMDLLVALAAVTAYLYSTVAMAVGRVEVYFDVTVVVVVAVTVGSYYERRMKRRAVGHLTELTRDRVGEARRRTATGTETIPVEAVQDGDELVIRAGERVPVDGEVLTGTAAVDESFLTGEPLPTRCRPGEAVRGGSLVTDGHLVIRAAGDGDRTIDRVVSLLWDVRGTTGTPQRLADGLATLFVPVVLALGGVTFLAHLALGATLTDALLTGLTVLVVSCPCALGLATPLAVAAGTRQLLADGVVLTDGSSIETASDVDILALDKTGTLTTGSMTVTDVVAADDTTSEMLLTRAAAVEQASDHPVSSAIIDAATPSDAPADLPEVTDFETHPGRGISGSLSDGDRVTVGSAELFETNDVPVPLRERYETAVDTGALPAYVGWNGRVRGVIVARDQPRPGWREAVARLGRDRQIVVLTGDESPAAARLADTSSIEAVYSGLPPAGKTETVRRLRSEGTVAMVGDGSNDAPALAAADLGIAMATGTELAADAADLVLLDDDLTRIEQTLSVLGRLRRRVRENLLWAFCYNLIAVPAAALGVITPLVAAVAMTGSSLLVVANSARSLTSGHEPVDTSESGDKRASNRSLAADSPDWPRTTESSHGAWADGGDPQ